MELKRGVAGRGGIIRGACQRGAVYVVLALQSALTGCSAGATGEPDLSRYPRRVPEWLWQDPRHAGLVSPALRAGVERDLRQAGSMRVFGETPAVLRKERQVARRLAAAFSAGDLAHGAPVFACPRDGLALAVRIDPAFDAQARRTLSTASQLFVRYALDAAVIERAVAASGPRDRASLETHLRRALSPHSGEPAVLVISSYRGNAWWGGAKLNFFNDPTYHLCRVPPPRGYLYIRLNTDKLRASEPHGQHPAFWAGKIAHEVLHNLGYTHPWYKDPADRDARNRGTVQAFVIAYEREVFRRASAAACVRPSAAGAARNSRPARCPRAMTASTPAPSHSAGSARLARSRGVRRYSSTMQPSASSVPCS